MGIYTFWNSFGTEKPTGGRARRLESENRSSWQRFFFSTYICIDSTYRTVDFKDSRFFKIAVKSQFWVLKEKDPFLDFSRDQRIQEKYLKNHIFSEIIFRFFLTFLDSQNV